MRTNYLAVVFLLVTLPLFAADAPKNPAPTPPSPAIPQAILDALALVQKDAQAVADSSAAIAQAQVAAAQAQQQLSESQAAATKAAASLSIDQANLIAVIQQIYGPVVPPKPPDPIDPPTPSGNLRVLFLYDSEKLITLPPAQGAILTDGSIRSYLEKHCPKESGCVTNCPPIASAQLSPSFRFLDKDIDTTKLSPVWQQTVSAAKPTSYPWVLIATDNGKVYEGPWEPTAATMLAKLKKYGGDL